MKSIEVIYHQSNIKFINDFRDVFLKDVVDTAEPRGIKITFLVFKALICGLIDAMTNALNISKSMGVDNKLTRIEMEITNNKSIKFKIVPLRADGSPAMEDKHNPFLFFLITEEDEKCMLGKSYISLDAPSANGDLMN